MAQVFNKIYVDVRTKNNDIITAVQNDSNSRFLDVFLFDNGSTIDLTGHEVRIYGKKADEKEIYNNGTITEATNGRCQFELTDQALAVAQDLTVQIVLYYNNVQILQSLPFTIHVVESLISNGSVESSNEYGALVVLYQNLYEAHDLMTTMTQNQGNKGEVSTERNIETFWQALEYVAKYMDTDLKGKIDEALANASVKGVLDLIGGTADTGGSVTAGTIMAKLNGLFTASVVKSIQLGTAVGTAGSNCTITISTVNPSKCFVIIQNDLQAFGAGSNGNTYYGARLISISTNNIIVRSAYDTKYNSALSFSYQVIEFY